ncbi:hypothetical protein [Clostridium butyricum]|uniref:HNH endonuclease n=1 Tax=Clostridium butyricum E4 str. BoNT E BL5262 TaxID=632245 RepID=C4IET9_CLOBU|nr:hypothetical protein [Clostridium butyricum]EEP55655.1 hypothetical protein CLP_3915 [Clostridium butyricum E4 str. BoNT E BL5262]NFL29701.1 hypothetical protein [Clostridium butyricum]NFS16794.1 hypothetical protein [Clostridium butyricum]
MGLDDKMKTWFGTMTFDSKHCFLCGELLDENNSTVEHIFPKWLQHKHGLWDQTLRLPNGSPIKYKQLIVPCCKKCNNEHLSSMEKSVREALDSGIEKVKELDKTIIYKWVIKIIYCLLFKELSLKEDIKSRDSKMIITPEFLKNYSVMFDYMQSIMGNIKINENISSVFIFNVLSNSGNDPQRDFFYIDDILHAQFAIRSNEIGIICSL